jgi:hypothetical protein
MRCCVEWRRLERVERPAQRRVSGKPCGFPFDGATTAKAQSRQEKWSKNGKGREDLVA